MKNAPFWIIDAFTGHSSRILRGNPAAVVLLDQFPPDAQLQERAHEFNLSETAFVVPRAPHSFDLRWFTPAVEVDLCGHATLAATAALINARHLAPGQTAHFHTRSGLLRALVQTGAIELEFPAQPVEPAPMPAELAAAFGWDHTRPDFARQYPTFRAPDDWLILVSQSQLEAVRPDFVQLAQLDARGVILTARSDHPANDIDFYSRFFCPRLGINEDPVTGSTHTKLAPFWSPRLGKTHLKAVQLSPRGGSLELNFDPRANLVAIAGNYHLRAHGHLD